MTQDSNGAPDYAGHSGTRWTYEAEETSDGYTYSVYDEHGQRLTEPYISAANARRIAAVQEMLAALKVARACINALESRNALMDIEAAIALATKVTS